MNSRFITAVSCAIACFTLAGTAIADPLGTEYSMELTLFQPGDPLPLALERHVNNAIPFDETTKEGALVHVAPNPDVDNDLNVMEMVTHNDQQDVIEIWIEGKPLLSNQQRVPMFTETVPQAGDMVRFSLDQLHWQDFEGIAIIEDLHFAVTYNDPVVPFDVSPVDLAVSGLGTQGSPLSIRADFVATDFDMDNQGLLDATDFHVSLTVRHIPEPMSLVLGTIAAVALLGCSSRLRRL